MENLIFSLNATVPIFLLMVLGFLLRQAGLFDENYVEKTNRFVFQAALPTLLFSDLAMEDFRTAWDGRFVGFCFAATVGCILFSVLISLLLRSRILQGEFVQASYRSSAAILGIAFIRNIYGDSGMAPLMIVGTVPLYNVMAVIVLSLMKPGGELNQKTLGKTFRGIVTNPILLGIVAGLVWSVAGLPMPVILEKTAGNVAALATPLGLMAMGAAFDGKKAFAMVRPALICSLLKLVGFAAVLLPVAVCLGFREEALVAILVMAGSATTVSCYVMARNMGHEGVLTSSVVMMTTFLSAFTLTGWLFVLKMLGLI